MTTPGSYEVQLPVFEGPLDLLLDLIERAELDITKVALAQVTRVDYGSVSQFISVLMQCLGSGKTITLRGHNALIHELFRVMGIDQLAQLVPHHPD